MIKLKVGRNTFDIDQNDLILDNGACYQIITKEIIKGWNKYPPKMSKKLFNDLKKTNIIYTNDDLKQAAIKRYPSINVTLWKFDIEQMKKNGY